jgi:hypothetical protein
MATVLVPTSTNSLEKEVQTDEPREFASVAGTPTVGDVGVGTMCTACDSTCGACSGASATECTACANSDLLSGRNTCSVTCATGTFVSGGACVMCDAGCDDCSGTNACYTDSCAGALVYDNGICREHTLAYATAATVPTPADAVEIARPQNCDDDYDTVHVLTGAVGLTVIDGTTLEMTLNAADQNAIKMTDKIAKAESSTWLAFSSAAIVDMARPINQINPVSHTSGKAVGTVLFPL